MNLTSGCMNNDRDLDVLNVILSEPTKNTLKYSQRDLTHSVYSISMLVL